MFLETAPRAGREERRSHRGAAPAALDVEESDEGGVRILTLRGELDLATAPSACVRLDAARRRPRPRVVVDLSGVRFCDSTGLRALLGAANEVAAAAGRLAIVVPADDGPIARLLTVSGARELLPVHESLPSALASLRAPRHV
jgi:anti-sigma B factor antagonist